MDSLAFLIIHIYAYRTAAAFTLFDTEYYGYLCLKMTKITAVSYRYYLHVRKYVALANISQIGQERSISDSVNSYSKF